MNSKELTAASTKVKVLKGAGQALPIIQPSQAKAVNQASLPKAPRVRLGAPVGKVLAAVV